MYRRVLQRVAGLTSRRFGFSRSSTVARSSSSTSTSLGSSARLAQSATLQGNINRSYDSVAYHSWTRSTSGHSGRSDGIRSISSTASQDDSKQPSSEQAAAPSAAEASSSFWDTWFTSKGAELPEGTEINRWSMAVPATLIHFCIGAPYAWSAISGPLTRELGVVTSAVDDWSLAETSLPMSFVFGVMGLSAATLGMFQARVGPRATSLMAAACYGGGFGLAAMGVAMHSLPVMYAGIGALAGLGLGVGYTPPVQALMRWMPDRKGVASGLTIAGFGSGALFFAPMTGYLLDTFKEAPTVVGKAAEVATTQEGGKLMAKIAGGRLVEVVEATGEAINNAAAGLEPATSYLVEVGSGNTGAAATLATFGALYAAILAGSAAAIRLPPPGYVPPVATADASVAAAAAGTSTGEAVAKSPDEPEGVPPMPVKDLGPNEVIKTPEFLLLATTFTAVAGGGMALFAVAKPMMNDLISSGGAALLGSIPAATASVAYLQMVSMGNLGGRLGWAAFSDKFGRATVFRVFTWGSIPLFLSVPLLSSYVADHNSFAALAGFALSTAVAVSMMGGTYAVLPAYEADLFGTKNVGANHGRMLLGSTAAALGGPSLLLALRGISEQAAIQDLVKAIDPAKFRDIFGKSPEDPESIQALIESKSLTIQSALAAAPPGTPDPSSGLYDSTMYTMAGVLFAAALAHEVVAMRQNRRLADWEAKWKASGAVEAEGKAREAAEDGVRASEVASGSGGKDA